MTAWVGLRLCEAVCEVLWGDCVCVGPSVSEAHKYPCGLVCERDCGCWGCLRGEGAVRLCRAVGRREAMMSAGGLVCGCVGQCFASG